MDSRLDGKGGFYQIRRIDFLNMILILHVLTTLLF